MTIILFVFAFLLSFPALRHLHPEGILFFQGVVFGGILFVLQIIIARFIQREGWKQSFKDALLSFLIIYTFMFTVPTTVDRSYSVKMINHLADAPNGLSRDELNAFYVADFVEKGGIEKRLKEQDATGTLTERDGRYEITRTGKLIDATFRAMCTVFVCSG